MNIWVRIVDKAWVGLAEKFVFKTVSTYIEMKFFVGKSPHSFSRVSLSQKL
jgi:hypothetical protein